MLTCNSTHDSPSLPPSLPWCPLPNKGFNHLYKSTSVIVFSLSLHRLITAVNFTTNVSGTEPSRIELVRGPILENQAQLASLKVVVFLSLTIGWFNCEFEARRPLSL